MNKKSELKKYFKIFFFIPLSLFSSCASYTEETVKMVEAYRYKEYDKAQKYLDDSGLKDQSRNRLLYSLEEAMIFDRMQDRPKSRRLLLNADSIADELYTVSLSKEAASLLVNDAQTDYSGEDYELVAIHTMLALSFLQDGMINEARVEAKRINTKLQQLTENREKGSVKYYEDGYARFLSGLIYESKEQYDDALIDYKKAFEIFSEPGYRSFYFGSVPTSLVVSYYHVAKKRNRSDLLQQLESSYKDTLEPYKLKDHSKMGSVVVLHEMGMVSPKIHKDFVLPFGSQLVRFSFPYIKPYFYNYGQTGVQLDEGVPFVYANNVAHMSRIAYQCLEDRRGRMFLKNAARLLAKGQAAEQARQKLGPLAGLAVNALNVVTETADTRSWSLLPDAFFVTRVFLPPKEHTLKIKNDGRLSQIQKVTVASDGIKFIRDTGSL